MAVKDFTRPDQRNEISPEPVWISSKVIEYTDLKNNTLIVAALRKGAYMCHAYAVEVLTAGATNTGYDIAFGTTPVPLGLTTPQYTYEGVTISNAAIIVSDADDGASSIAASAATGLIISATDDVVITVAEDDANTITAGKFRVHVLVSEVPFASI